MDKTCLNCLSLLIFKDRKNDTYLLEKCDTGEKVVLSHIDFNNMNIPASFDIQACGDWRDCTK